MNTLRIEPLARHPGRVDTLVGWFEAEWPGWYLSGPGDARADLEAFQQLDRLPLGLVALQGEALVGFAALKARSIDSHANLTPWAAAGLVAPALRGQGIGLQLLRALEAQAAALGFPALHCGTATSERLLQRAGWQRIGQTLQHGETVGIYVRRLPGADR